MRRKRRLTQLAVVLAAIGVLTVPVGASAVQGPLAGTARLRGCGDFQYGKAGPVRATRDVSCRFAQHVIRDVPCYPAKGPVTCRSHGYRCAAKFITRLDSEVIDCRRGQSKIVYDSGS